MKTARQNLVRELISGAPIYTQEELRKWLAQKGIQVNQATLSRDLREIGVVKTANGYSLPTQDDTGGSPLPSLTHLVREFVVDVREAENQLVLKTTPGSAQPVAAGLDSSNWKEIVGTIAGDDTILVITESKVVCRKLAERIREIVEG
ncbi:MAG TPA: arginine repressor [Terriglobales bacterium]|nr:arginine repressor [Terriglobales bacterium]